MPLFLGGAPRLTGRMHLIRQRLGRRGNPPEGAGCVPQAIDSVVQGPKYLVS